MSKPASPRRFGELEKIVRGFANHRRIQVLYLLAERPGLDLTAIAMACGTKFQTASEHVRRLSESRLVAKRRKGRQVLHHSTALGRQVLRFLDGIA